MTDRPIIFSAPMILALLAGRKTMTRRLAWRDAEPNAGVAVPTIWQKVRPGDRLWARETWQDCDEGPMYRATWPTEGAVVVNWRSPIHMPRSASRITLTVAAARMERLHAISEDDAIAEGLWYCDEGEAAGFWFGDPSMRGPVYGEGAVECYARLWETLHSRASWDANPDVVALTFAVEQKNIDQ